MTKAKKMDAAAANGERVSPLCCFIHIVDKIQLNYYESAVLAKDGSAITRGRDRIYFKEGQSCRKHVLLRLSIRFA